MFVYKPILRYSFCNLYKTLGISPDATQIEIRQSYLNLAKKVHPDTGVIAAQQFVRIQSAYETLKDPHLRRIYDRQAFPEKQNFQIRNFHYYTDEQPIEDPSKAWMKGIQYIGILGIFMVLYYLYQTYQPMTESEIRRQNIFLANQNVDGSPSAQQKRRKQYLLQMKQKKFSANVVTLKVGNGAQQSTKARKIRKHSIQSIVGVTKEEKQLAQDYNKQKYM